MPQKPRRLSGKTLSRLGSGPQKQWQCNSFSGTAKDGAYDVNLRLEMDIPSAEECANDVSAGARQRGGGEQKRKYAMNVQLGLLAVLILSCGLAINALAADESIKEKWAGPGWYQTDRSFIGVPTRLDGPYSTKDACAAALRSFLMKSGQPKDDDLDCEYWRNETDEPTP